MPGFFSRCASWLKRIRPAKDSYSALQRKIRYRFQNIDLLTEALSHRSSLVNPNSPSRSSNERLEFLGDSVLGLLVADSLFRLHPQEPEGELTRIKAALVNEQTLSAIAKGLSLGDHILLSPDEAKSGGRERASITSDCLEAIIGAVYLDGGIKPARKFVERFVVSRSQEAQRNKDIHNYKGELLELVQSRGAGLPRYEVVKTAGPDHQKVFSVAVYGFGRELGRGQGHSKKEAEQKAAEQALRSARALLKSDQPGTEEL